MADTHYIEYYVMKMDYKTIYKFTFTFLPLRSGRESKREINLLISIHKNLISGSFWIARDYFFPFSLSDFAFQ